MASIRKRPRSDGTTAYAVLYRLPGSRKQHSKTFDNKNLALGFKSKLDAADAKRHYSNALNALTHALNALDLSGEQPIK